VYDFGMHLRMKIDLMGLPISRWMRWKGDAAAPLADSGLLQDLKHDVHLLQAIEQRMAKLHVIARNTRLAQLQSLSLFFNAFLYYARTPILKVDEDEEEGEVGGLDPALLSKPLDAKRHTGLRHTLLRTALDRYRTTVLPTPMHEFPAKGWSEAQEALVHKAAARMHRLPAERRLFAGELRAMAYAALNSYTTARREALVHLIGLGYYIVLHQRLSLAWLRVTKRLQITELVERDEGFAEALKEAEQERIQRELLKIGRELKAKRDKRDSLEPGTIDWPTKEQEAKLSAVKAEIADLERRKEELIEGMGEFPDDPTAKKVRFSEEDLTAENFVVRDPKQLMTQYRMPKQTRLLMIAEVENPAYAPLTNDMPLSRLLLHLIDAYVWDKDVREDSFEAASTSPYVALLLHVYLSIRE